MFAFIPLFVASVAFLSLYQQQFTVRRWQASLYSSSPYVVSMSTLARVPVDISRSVAFMPSSTGMRMSIITTSGSSAWVNVIASHPSSASPTTSIAMLAGEDQR